MCKDNPVVNQTKFLIDSATKFWLCKWALGVWGGWSAAESKLQFDKVGKLDERVPPHPPPPRPTLHTYQKKNDELSVGVLTVLPLQNWVTTHKPLYTVKKIAFFPSLAGMSQSLVSDIPAGDRKIANPFLQSKGGQSQALDNNNLLNKDNSSAHLKRLKPSKSSHLDLEISIFVKIF